MKQGWYQEMKQHRKSPVFKGRIFRIAFLVGCCLWLCVPCGVDAKEDLGLLPLRVALLPILDSLPFYVAEAEGYFAKEGLEMEAVPVGSGLERDQLMQAGEIDGMLNEMTTTASFNRAGPLVKIVAAARTAYPDYPLFRVLSAPESGLIEPGQLAGVSIGVSKNTIIEYVTDRLLQLKGLKRDQILKKSVPVIPERYQLLLHGRLKAATLPDPLARSAMAAGALNVVDDSVAPRYSMSVLSFSTRSLAEKSKAVYGFLRAWDRAAARINASPEVYRPLLLSKIRVPRNVRKSYVIPPFPRGRVPDADQWADVMQWMCEKRILKAPLPYGESVTRAFLPPVERRGKP